MAASATTWRLGGRSVRVSNLDKLYWPEDGLTKGDLLAYYREMAPVLLPYLADRPATLRVYPRGIHGFSYYRRERPEKAPTWVRSVEYETATDGHRIQAFTLNDEAGLIWAANTGGIEIHLWSVRAANLTEPDLAVFDLDPGDEASFDAVLEAAGILHDALEQRGLRSYPKTSGGQGLHVWLPLAPGHTFARVRDWVRDIAEELAAAHPTLFAVAHGSTHRGRQVTIDHAQNSTGRNTAAPYTVRALPGAGLDAADLGRARVRAGASG